MSQPTAPRKRMGCVLRTAAILVVLVILVVATLAIYQQIGLRRAQARHPAPGTLIDVGGHRMHLRCTGSGSPTVVIDAGNNCFSLEWTPIQDALQADTRVCTYDRAGYGWSEPGPAPRDGAEVVAELHALLQAAGEQGPYVLVGHSLGGIHVRIYAGQYPDEVAGLVLVDTAAEYVLSPEMARQMQSSIGFYQVMRLLAGSGLLRVIGPLGGEGMMPETARKLPATLQGAYLEMLLDPQPYTTAIAEMTQLPQTLGEAGKAMAGAHPLGDRPLIVLTAGQQAPPGSTPFDNKRVPRDEAIIAAQAELAALSTRGEQRVIAESGHQVHLDASEAVLAAIRDVVTMARTP